ncbi:hypothetical protein GMRT_10754 [Giardia muris]|uniref:Uncharacterized protein n=1 Tax=Giardia muris TaxID=5742 RepID=A0A4Z1T4R6_GIAMU|nr:hypothetical protein GMRT_10754 [Giardia muris]|eukprot:TNJ30658.1 hypothetical protein GMRT_10754 [Giardia muris]
MASQDAGHTFANLISALQTRVSLREPSANEGSYSSDGSSSLRSGLTESRPDVDVNVYTPTSPTPIEYSEYSYESYQSSYGSSYDDDSYSYDSESIYDESSEDANDTDVVLVNSVRDLINTLSDIIRARPDIARDLYKARQRMRKSERRRTSDTLATKRVYTEAVQRQKETTNRLSEPKHRFYPDASNNTIERGSTFNPLIQGHLIQLSSSGSSDPLQNVDLTVTTGGELQQSNRLHGMDPPPSSIDTSIQVESIQTETCIDQVLGSNLANESHAVPDCSEIIQINTFLTEPPSFRVPVRDPSKGSGTKSVGPNSDPSVITPRELLQTLVVTDLVPSDYQKTAIPLRQEETSQPQPVTTTVRHVSIDASSPPQMEPTASRTERVSGPSKRRRTQKEAALASRLLMLKTEAAMRERKLQEKQEELERQIAVERKQAMNARSRLATLSESKRILENQLLQEIEDRDNIIKEERRRALELNQSLLRELSLIKVDTVKEVTSLRSERTTIVDDPELLMVSDLHTSHEVIPPPETSKKEEEPPKPRVVKNIVPPVPSTKREPPRHRPTKGPAAPPPLRMANFSKLAYSRTPKPLQFFGQDAALNQAYVDARAAAITSALADLDESITTMIQPEVKQRSEGKEGPEPPEKVKEDVSDTRAVSGGNITPAHVPLMGGVFTRSPYHAFAAATAEDRQ